MALALCRLTAYGGQSAPDETPQVRMAVSDDALAAARAMLAVDVTSAAANAKLGNALLLRGEFDAALGYFETALRINPGNVEAMAGKGTVLARKGDLAAAEKLLRGALLQSPDPVRLHYELGLIYQKQGDFNRAVAEFKEGISKFRQGRR
ncbi:tetratricopeptide repeat protein [Geomonas agri]|uniref:tetratricopeptide repeat protein n=1 Tax=Geomonas agri TaxID=2873702 RepID=UPI001CD81AC2|nr:tetratricopeptide repeat protein [Geomonas agri]